MDHQRVNCHDSVMSCGVMELSRIDDDTVGVLYALGARLYHPSRGNPAAMFVFSDIADGEENSSTRLIKRVAQYRLGTTGCTPAIQNPRTGNFITMWWWNIDHEQFKKWYAKERVTRLGKVGR